MAINDTPGQDESPDRRLDPVNRYDEDGGVPQRRFTPPSGSTTIYLVRHGATQAAHPDRPFETRDGHGDPPLAAVGVDQARAVCARLEAEHALEPFASVYVTSLRRTLETATPFLDATGLDGRLEADLREVHLGDYEGGVMRLKGAEGDPLVREVYTQERWDIIPGAETWDAFQGRCVAAIERIVGQNQGQRVLAFVHGGVIGAVLSHVTRSRNFAFVGADNSSISEIVHMGQPIDRWALRRFNDMSHLDELRESDD